MVNKMAAEELFQERNFFIGPETRRLYCVEQIPISPLKKSHGIVLCKPIWGERIRTHRIFTNLGRYLARLGYSVISCDYFGDGNSGGDSMDLNYFGMTDDILFLHRYMSRNYNVQKFSFVGLLIGANVAISSSAKIDDLDKMVLFEPLLNPVEHLKKALRANLTSQMVIHKKIIKNRESLIEDLKKGVPVNIDGFMIGKNLWESFEDVSPYRAESDFEGPVFIYGMSSNGKRKTDFSVLAAEFENCQWGTIEQEFEWTDWKHYIPSPRTFFDTVTRAIV